MKLTAFKSRKTLEEEQRRAERAAREAGSRRDLSPPRDYARWKRVTRRTPAVDVVASAAANAAATAAAADDVSDVNADNRAHAAHIRDGPRLPATLNASIRAAAARAGQRADDDENDDDDNDIGNDNDAHSDTTSNHSSVFEEPILQFVKVRIFTTKILKKNSCFDLL